MRIYSNHADSAGADDSVEFHDPLICNNWCCSVFGEVIRTRRIIAICIGFLGAIIILQPGVVELTLGTFIALVSSLSIAMASLIVKSLTRNESQQAIVAWIVFAELPGFWTCVGGIIIFASTVYITRRETSARQSMRPTIGQDEPRL